MLHRTHLGWLSFCSQRALTVVLGAGLLVALPTLSASAAVTPTVEQALKLQPLQKDVDYDKPAAAEIAKCAIKAEKTGGKTGWTVRDGNGQLLRNFADTNSDNVVDQWSYYKDGVEVYRDIDSNFNGKADQCRWLNTGGTRWGMLAADDGRNLKIESWKIISAEEVTAELVAAMRDNDVERFERLLLSSQELKSLGLGMRKAASIAKRVQAAPSAFRQVLKEQKVVGPETRWASLGATRPGLVPAGSDDSENDLWVYENASAMVATGDKHAQVTVGALVRVREVWRLIDAPTLSGDNSPDPELAFIPAPLAPKSDGNSAAREGDQRWIKIIEDIDKQPANTPAEIEKQTLARCEARRGFGQLMRGRRRRQAAHRMAEKPGRFD